MEALGRPETFRQTVDAVCDGGRAVMVLFAATDAFLSSLTAMFSLVRSTNRLALLRLVCSRRLKSRGLFGALVFACFSCVLSFYANAGDKSKSLAVMAPRLAACVFPRFFDYTTRDTTGSARLTSLGRSRFVVAASLPFVPTSARFRYRAGFVDVTSPITARYSLVESAQAYRDLDAHKITGRAVVDMHF